MIGIRQKLVLGFGGLLLIVVAMGMLTMRQIEEPSSGSKRRA